MIRLFVFRIWIFSILALLVAMWLLSREVWAAPLGLMRVRLDALSAREASPWIFVTSLVLLLLAWLVRIREVLALVRAVILVGMVGWLAALCAELYEPLERARERYVEMVARNQDELFDPDTGRWVKVGFREVLMIRPAGWAFAGCACGVVALLMLPGESLTRRPGQRPGIRSTDENAVEPFEARWTREADLGHGGLNPSALPGRDGSGESVGEDNLALSTLLLFGVLREEKKLCPQFHVLRRLFVSRFPPSNFVRIVARDQRDKEKVEALTRRARRLRELVRRERTEVCFIHFSRIKAESASVGQLLQGSSNEGTLSCVVGFYPVSKRGFLAISDAENPMPSNQVRELLSLTCSIGESGCFWVVYGGDVDPLWHEEGAGIGFHALRDDLARLNPALYITEFIANPSGARFPAPAGNSRSVIERFRKLVDC